MDMNKVNFLVVALSCTLLFVVGQRDRPVEESTVNMKQSACAMNMEELNKLTAPGESAAFLSKSEAQEKAGPQLLSKPIQGNCAETCQWQVLNFALLGDDSLYYTPATGVGFGSALIYQSIYACKCREPRSVCGSQCYSVPASDPWGHCNYFQQTWLPSQCTCPVRTCEHTFSWHRILVWPNFPIVNRCDPPVWKYVQIPTGCCCKVTAFSVPTGPIGK